MRRDITKYIILAIIVFLVFYFLIPSVNYSNCINAERFMKSSFEGIVVNKYLDNQQHSVPTIEVLNDHGQVNKLYLFGEYSGLYESISLHDTIVKSKGSSNVFKQRNGAFEFFHRADFNCDSVALQKEEYLFGIYEFTGFVPRD